MIVGDASAILEVLLGTRDGARVAERLFTPGETLHAPHLLDFEVAQVPHRYALAGELDAPRGLATLEDLADLPTRRVGEAPALATPSLSPEMRERLTKRRQRARTARPAARPSHSHYLTIRPRS